MSSSDAPTFHHDLPFIPLHYTYVPFTSSPQFTTLTHPSRPHHNSLHFSFTSYFEKQQEQVRNPLKIESMAEVIEHGFL
jgi:hypothetical protein